MNINHIHVAIFSILSILSLPSCKQKNSSSSDNLKYPPMNDSDLSIKINLNKEYWSQYEGTLHFVPANDSIREKSYDITITVINKSLRVISFWTMSTAWFENFFINNEYIHYYLSGSIDHNFPHVVKIKSNDSLEFKITLAREISYDNPDKNSIGNQRVGKLVPETRVGLLFIDADKYQQTVDYDMIMRDRSKWNKFIWSNALNLNK